MESKEFVKAKPGEDITVAEAERLYADGWSVVVRGGKYRGKEKTAKG